MSALPLAKPLREALTGIGCPTTFYVTGERHTRTLIERGYARSIAPDGDGWVCITPAGLRRLADELEAGRVVQGLPERKTP